MTTLERLVEQIEALPRDQKSTLLSKLMDPVREQPTGLSVKEALAGIDRLDSISAREMMDAIEDGCECVDVREW